MEKKPLSHIIKGLIIVTLVIGTSFIIEKAGLSSKSFAILLPSLLLIIGIAVSGILFSKQTNVKIFAEIFAHGFKTAAVVICLMAVYTYSISKFFTPPPSATEIEIIKKDLLSHGNIMPQEVEQKVNEGLKNEWIFKVGQSIFSSLVAGAIGAGLGALIRSKSNQ
jgi:hypothetical protein